MKEKTGIKPKLASQILEFFKRHKTQAELDDTLPILESLHNKLLEGHSSLNLTEVGKEIEILKVNDLVGGPEELRPLILTASGDLYFKRYFDYEISIAKKLREWSTISDQDPIMDYSHLDNLFSNDADQLKAAKLSIKNKFSVITGGPGTGKTFLVVSILHALLQNNPEIKILLAAPTGKAAQRMTESILLNLERFDLREEEKQRFPKEASTIHRLLQPRPPSIHFGKNQRNPLDADFLIIDEASMIDLPLMAKLFRSIPNECGLILVGDVDQLAPVEAGAPFASIVRHFLQPDHPRFVAKLSTNRRFSATSSIHRLCRAISSGDSAETELLIDEEKHEDFEFLETWDDSKINQAIIDGYASLIKAKTPAEAHQAFLKFQILCPTHQGNRGVIAMNERCQKILVNDPDLYFSGLPIIIKQNDYGSELFNGDIGIFLPTQENSDELSVWFAGNKGNYRKFSPARLPPFDLAFAMTIHRSQGSEYQDVMITLPLTTSEILSRHLLYVACSRAKRMVRIYGSKEIFLETVRKSSKYSLGLENRLKEII